MRGVDCVVGKSGQSTNPIIANVDPVPYNSICARWNLLIANVGKTRNSQLIDTRIKTRPTVYRLRRDGKQSYLLEGIYV